MARPRKPRAAPQAPPPSANPALEARAVEEIMGKTSTMGQVRASRERPPAGLEVYCRIPHTYGEEKLAHRQVIKLSGEPNDEKLLRLGYLVKVDRALYCPAQCGRCGKWFLDGNALDGHGRADHEPKPNRLLELLKRRTEELRSLGRPLTEMEQYELDDLAQRAGVAADKEDDQRDKAVMRDGGPYLDQTAASRG